MSGVLVRVSVAPLLSQPALQSEQVSQVPLGEGAEVLETRGTMLRVRTLFDADEGWLHRGYTVSMSLDDVLAWRERAEWSLGVTLRSPDGARRHVPHRGRVLRRDAGTVTLPDGEEATILDGTLLDAAALRAAATVLPPAEWAWQEFAGVPYLWGGITRAGLDCSALVQQTFAARGIILPRDSSEQASMGSAVDPDAADAGDLLFFRSAEGSSISHVALHAGGALIVHATIDTGGVTRESWSEGSRAAILRPRLAMVRRVA